MPALFQDWMIRLLDLAVTPIPEARRVEYEAIINGVAESMAPGRKIWRELPGILHQHLGARGWGWNGIYARHGDERLVLFSAHGPPVCADLLRTGGPGTSGMCWDAVLMNQTLAASDVTRWPGYVSCDAESGLATAAGMACPIRDPAGSPIAVWDLDATEHLATEDPPFFDRLFATLSARISPTADVFTGPPSAPDSRS